MRVKGVKGGVWERGGMIMGVGDMGVGGGLGMGWMIGEERMKLLGWERVLWEGRGMSGKGEMVMRWKEVGIGVWGGIGKKKGGKRGVIGRVLGGRWFWVGVGRGKGVMVGGGYVGEWGGMVRGVGGRIGLRWVMKVGGKGVGKGVKRLKEKVVKNRKIEKGLGWRKKVRG